MNTQLLEQARKLDVSEQIRLVEAIWDGIASRGEAPPLTDAQKAELDRRLAQQSRQSRRCHSLKRGKSSRIRQAHGMKASSRDSLLSSWQRSNAASRKL
jgi:putative addiction module component (TIGR02574 family)